jgi:uridine phosphorylase
MSRADKPKTKDDKEYHLHTGQGDLSPLCLIVGAPGRALMIAKAFLEGVKTFSNPHRGMESCTGTYHGVRVSVTTSGMGGASIGIALPEAVRSGARIIIRVGSCGSLIQRSKPGHAIIVSSAVRLDGVAENWAPIQYPACADWRVMGALVEAAKERAPKKFFVGVEATTGDFNNGQGRPDLYGVLPPHMAARHNAMLHLGVGCYSMEAANLFVWCATQGRGLPAGAINAVYGNRITNQWDPGGDELAAHIALEALVKLSKQPEMKHFMFRKLPKSKQK